MENVDFFKKEQNKDQIVVAYGRKKDTMIIEFIEIKPEKNKIEFDTPVYVRNSEDEPWKLRYFCGFGEYTGKIQTWSGSKNSYNHYYFETELWDYYKLAEDTLFPEISLIKSNKLRDFAEYCASKIPEYFYHIPASSSGKHHPEYALGEGGLLRHTKAAVKIAEDLLSLEHNNRLDHDIIIFSLIFHDCIKQGYISTGHTKFNHPVLAAEFIFDCYSQYLEETEKHLILPIHQICHCIRSHMGEWNTNKRDGNVILDKPITAEFKFVHMCDYLASRKYLEVDFNK